MVGTRGGSTVHIVGGGLAGMTVARELAEQGLTVRIIESSPRLGGKATAHQAEHTGAWEDHGYHIFPSWYANTRRLLRELGCEAHLIDFDRWHWLRRGEFPKVIPMLEMSSLRNLWRDVNCGIRPPSEMIVSGYFLVDLLSQPFSYRQYLDRVSVAGFLRSRFYASDSIAELHHQFALQASSAPYYELSAMTLQKIFNGWAKIPSPPLSILDGNLRDRFIAPFEADLRRRLNVEVLCNSEVVRLELAGAPQARRIARLWLRGGAPLPNTSPDDTYVLCVPHGEAYAFLNNDVYDAEHPQGRTLPDQVYMSDLAQLSSVPMAAWSVYFNRKIPGLPREHVNLVDSLFGLSFIDVSQTRPGLDTTVLNCIAAYYEPISHLSQADAERQLRRELLEYLPGVSEDDIVKTYLQPHTREPLFLNTLAAWHFRPEARSAIPNLYFAGDYCRSEADLTTMESAIGSGLRAAAAILKTLGKQPRIVELPMPARPRWQLVLVKYLAMPVIAVLALWLKWRGPRE